MINVDRIQQRMADLGLNPFSAAKQAGLGQDYVRDLIRGKVKQPSAAKLRDLAIALQCSADYLMGDSEDKGTPPEAFEAKARPVKLRVERVIRSGFYEPRRVPAPLKEQAFWVVSAGYDVAEWLEFVEDAQLNGAVPGGSYAHVVSAAEFHHGLTNIVLVESTRGEGSYRLIERSIKKIEFNNRGVTISDDHVNYQLQALFSESGVSRMLTPSRFGMSEDQEVAAPIKSTVRVVGLVVRLYAFYDDGYGLDAPF